MVSSLEECVNIGTAKAYLTSSRHKSQFVTGIVILRQIGYNNCQTASYGWVFITLELNKLRKDRDHTYGT